MNDTEIICKTFNLVYFDFLDRKEEPSTRPRLEEVGKLTYREFLEFYAKSEDDTVAKHIGAKGKIYNIGDNFYIGHFLFESLMLSENGKQILFQILESRNRKIASYLKEIREQIKTLDKYDQEEYKNKSQNIINTKYFISYNQFLRDYEETKQNNISDFRFIYGNSGTSKNDYLEFLLSTSEPVKNFLKKKLEAFIPNKARYRNTYIIGQAGSGKSELIKGLVYSILGNQDKFDKSKGENFIVLDPHGDLAEDIFNVSVKYMPHYIDRLNRKRKTYLLDPFLDSGKTPIINPFDFEGNETERNSYTEELLNVFREILGSDFTLNAESLLIPCIATLLKIKNSSLYDLQRFMNDEQNRDLVERGKITTNTAHKTFFESGFYLSNLNSTKRAIFLKIQILLNNQTFSNLTTGKSTLDLENIMNNGHNLIIKLNKQKMRETLSPFGRFIIAKIQSIALKRANIPEPLRPKTHFFIDEFQNFISPTTEEILTESRKYKLFLTLAHQVISQIEEGRTKDIILSNTYIKLVGQNGQKTLSVLAKELGVKPQELENLKTGEFFARIGKNPAFKMYHKMLDYRYFKANNYTREYKQYLIDTTYTKPQKYKAPELKTDRKEDYINQVITDKKTTQELQKNITGQSTDKSPETRDLKPKKKPKFNDF